MANPTPDQRAALSAEMMHDRTSGKCSVCKASPVEMHHVAPVEYGFPESGLTLPVCGTDHTRIHRAGEHMVDTGGENPYIALYTDPLQAARATLLAEQIARTKETFLASGQTRAATARNAIQVHWSNDELGIAHDLKRKLGFKSLERMIKHIVLERWSEHNGGSQSGPKTPHGSK